MNQTLAALRHAQQPAAGHVAPPAAARNAWDTLRRTWRDLVGEIVRRHQAARAQAEIDALDDATLRDIGLHRSEAASYWAEAERLVEPTRLRLLARMHVGH